MLTTSLQAFRPTSLCLLPTPRRPFIHQSTHQLIQRHTQRLPHHRLDAGGEVDRVLQLEAGAQHGRPVQHAGHVAGGIVGAALLHQTEHLLDERVARVDLEGLALALIVGTARVVSLGVRLRGDDTLHVAGPAELGGHQRARGGCETVAHGHLAHLKRMGKAECLSAPRRMEARISYWQDVKVKKEKV